MGNYYYRYTSSKLSKNYFSWYKQKKWHGWTSLPVIQIKWIFGFYRYMYRKERIILTWDNFTIVWIFFLQSMGDKLEFDMLYRTKFLFRCITPSDSLCRLVIVFYVLYSRYEDAIKLTAFLLLFPRSFPRINLNFIIYWNFVSGNWMWQYTSINNFMLTKCNHDNSFIVDKIFNRIAAMRLESRKISIIKP
jgi:hypothetical protein